MMHRYGNFIFGALMGEQRELVNRDQLNRMFWLMIENCHDLMYYRYGLICLKTAMNTFKYADSILIKKHIIANFFKVKETPALVGILVEVLRDKEFFIKRKEKMLDFINNIT